VRHGRTAKQRVWLGPGRYRGGCGDAVTNHDPDSDANSNRYAFCMRADNAYTYANRHGDGDRHGNSDRHANSYCNRYGDSDGHGNSDRHSDGHGDSDYHANCQPHCNSIDNSHAATDANTQVAPNGQATRNASAQAIEFRRAGNSC
jgi:hypothetical protein